MARPLAQSAPQKLAGAIPPSRVIVTAGHVDHGKSTLVE